MALRDGLNKRVKISASALRKSVNTGHGKPPVKGGRGRGVGRYTNAQFRNAFARNTAWQSKAKGMGWDGGHSLTDHWTCIFCCVFASCCEDCSNCGCDDPPEEIKRHGGRVRRGRR